MTFNSSDGFTVKELIEALQQIPLNLQDHFVQLQPGDCGIPAKVTQVDVWDDGVELS